MSNIQWVTADWHSGRIIERETGRSVCTAQCHSDAARIVQCVNGWDALQAERDALRAALNELAVNCENANDQPFIAYVQRTARAALAGKGGAS